MKINGGKFRSLRPAVNIVVLRPMVSRLLPVSSLRRPFLPYLFRLCLLLICTSHFRIMTQYLLSLGAPALGSRTLGPKQVHKLVISVTVGWVTWLMSGWVRARRPGGEANTNGGDSHHHPRAVPQPQVRMRYSHFGCNVVHEDLPGRGGGRLLVCSKCPIWLR